MLLNSRPPLPVTPLPPYAPRLSLLLVPRARVNYACEIMPIQWVPMLRCRLHRRVRRTCMTMSTTTLVVYFVNLVTWCTHAVLVNIQELGPCTLLCPKGELRAAKNYYMCRHGTAVSLGPVELIICHHAFM